MKRYLFIFLLFSIHSFALVESSNINNGSILKKSSIFFDETSQFSLNQIIQNNLFQPYDKLQLNIGFSQTTIWIKLLIQNSSYKKIKKLLVLNSPLLEEIELYCDNNITKPLIAGVAHINAEHQTIFPNFPIELEAGEKKEFYLKIRSLWTPIDFTLSLQDEKDFYFEDQKQQLIKVIFLSMIFTLMLYGFILGVYTKDKSYLFYSFYLLTLTYQQGSYLGLNQLYLPIDFVTHIEIRMAVIKIALMIISSSLFAIEFLKTESIPLLHRIYQLFIVVAVLEMLFFNTLEFYYVKVVVFTSILLICFNLIASIVSYVNGNIQARLFILGFSIVFVSYVMMIATALGFTSIIQSYPNSLLWSTTLEALILSLAFADRYAILQKEKEKADRYILNEAHNRERIVQKEVVKKTMQLKKALNTKDLLLQEIHHRVKNNLQIILSMVRLQSDRITDKWVVEKFVDLENRINAVSKTYNMLLPQDNLEAIDMEDYIDSLLQDIQATMYHLHHEIRMEIDVDVMLPLKESVYVGLILNELVTNSYKYAFENNKGVIKITLHQEKKGFLLIVEDNGKGYSDKNSKSLGLKLIHTLVYEQLKGSMIVETKNLAKYSIYFSI
jgi:two-component sensor histidine kinase